MQHNSGEELPSGRVPHTVYTVSRQRTIIIVANFYTHAHRYLMGWATQRGLRPSNYLSKTSCMIVSGFRAALDLDTYLLSNLIRPRYAGRVKPGRRKPVLIMYIGFFACFQPYLSNANVAAKSPHSFSCPCSTEAVGIAHKTPRNL